MMGPDNYEDMDFPLSRFENMLKTNEILFFDSDEFEMIIGHYLELGRMALAKKAIHIALSQHPDASILKLLQVEILLFEDKLSQADEILNSIFEIEPYNPDIYIHKASILSKRDQHTQAVELLKKAEELLDDDEDIYSMIAMEYLFMEDYEQAKEYFIKCLEADEGDSAALFNIIYCFDFLGETEEAIGFLSDYLDKNPYSEIGWHQLGLQYAEIRSFEKALEAFDFAIISDDTFVGAYLEKGKVLEKLNRYSEAIECYLATLELDDPTAFAYMRIGRCHEKNNADEPALLFYNRALQEDPLLDKAWIAITEFYCRRKQYKRALFYIEKALSIDDKNVSYWKRYAKINKQLKRMRETEKGLRKSMECGNYDFETWITRCDILIDLHEFETALDLMEQARRFFPNTAEIEYRLAGLYLNLKDEKNGLAHLKTALNLDDEYAVVMEELFPDIFEYKNVLNLLEKKGFFG